MMPFSVFIEGYANAVTRRFGMPGHKGRPLPPYADTAVSASFPYGYDLKEVYLQPGDVDSPLLESERIAARLFGMDRTRFCTNGSTGAILTAMLATLSEGDVVVLPRESHVSLVGAFILTGVVPKFLANPASEHAPVSQGVFDIRDLERVIATSAPKAVVITSPNYFGIAMDLNRVSHACGSKGVLLVVDEAHGAHFHFSSRLPTSAVDVAADLVVHSGHKTLGGMYQTALLHTQGTGAALEAGIDAAHALLHTTSPSVPLLMSLDWTVDYWQRDGAAHLDALLDEVEELRSAVPDEGVEIVTLAPRAGGTGFPSHTASDPTKLCIRVPAGTSGRAVASVLRDRYRLDVELALWDTLLLTICVADRGRLSDLPAVLRDACALVEGTEPVRPSVTFAGQLGAHLPEVGLTPREAWNADRHLLSLEAAVGRVSAATVYAYPPGVPLLVPGEVLDGSTLDILRSLQRRGVRICGLHDDSSVQVVA